MKFFSPIITLIALAILFYSCNSPDTIPVKKTEANYNADTDSLTENKTIQDTTYSTDEVTKPNKNKAVNPVYDISATDKHETEIKAPAPVNINPGSITIKEDLSNEISHLTYLLNTYSNTKFNDCSSFETAVKDFTNRFFIVISKIELTDTVSISNLKKMEGFTEIFEPEFERVENECPDLYNDYMEYLDDYTDLYYSKLESMFGEDADK